MFRILASRTLGFTISNWTNCDAKECCLLFWIVHQICKYVQIELSLDAIPAHYDNAMLPCLEEFVIKHDLNLFVKIFTVAMGEESTIWTFPADQLGCKILELVW